MSSPPTPFRRVLCRGLSTLMPANTGPLIVASMVRNERDIIDVWTRHVAAIADRAILYDHLSEDGTREFLHDLAARDPRFEVRNYDTPRHDQAELMTQVLKEVTAQERDGWLFCLDADEFLPTRDAADLRARLARHRAATTLKMHVQHAIQADTRPHEITGADEILTWSDQRQAYGKIFVNLRFGRRVTAIHMGNHGASTKALLRKIPSDLEILHLPARSAAQLNRKLRLGTAANALRENGELTATHWQKWSQREQEEQDLRRIAHAYGHGDVDVPPAPDLSCGLLREIVPISG